MAVADINAEKADGTLAELSGAPGTHLSIHVDLTGSGAPERVVAQCFEKWGHLDLLVNNAAIGAIEPFFESTEELWNQTLAINVTASCCSRSSPDVTCAQAQRSHRRTHLAGGAHVSAGLRGLRGQQSRGRFGDSLFRSRTRPVRRAREHVAPGMMDTEMQRITETRLAAVENRPNVEEFLEERTRRVPLGRRAEFRSGRCGRLAVARCARLRHGRQESTPAAGSTRTDRMNTAPIFALDADLGALRRRAKNMRRHMLTMARGPGQGYVGQGMGIADTLAALSFPRDALGSNEPRG